MNWCRQRLSSPRQTGRGWLRHWARRLQNSGGGSTPRNWRKEKDAFAQIQGRKYGQGSCHTAKISCVSLRKCVAVLNFNFGPCCEKFWGKTKNKVPPWYFYFTNKLRYFTNWTHTLQITKLMFVVWQHPKNLKVILEFRESYLNNEVLEGACLELVVDGVFCGGEKRSGIWNLSIFIHSICSACIFTLLSNWSFWRHCWSLEVYLVIFCWHFQGREFWTATKCCHTESLNLTKVAGESHFYGFMFSVLRIISEAFKIKFSRLRFKGRWKTTCKRFREELSKLALSSSLLQCYQSSSSPAVSALCEIRQSRDKRNAESVKS